jgi:hydrogenase maturation protease
MKDRSRKTESTRYRRPRILVAGLGNLLLRDDGVGVHAVRQFQTTALAACLAVDVGCAVFDALHLFEWAEKILLIDAMQAGGSPGTVYKISIDDVEGGGIAASLHELSVVHALRMLNKHPLPHVSLIGVEPKIIDYGLELSEVVETSLPLVLEAGNHILKEWMYDGQIITSGK